MATAALQAYLSTQDPTARVTSFERVSGGWECDIYGFTLARADGSQQDLILREYLGEDSIPKMLRESSGLRQLRRAGYPVPEVFFHEKETSILGKPFLIMEKLEGQTLWGKLLTVPPEQEHELIQQFGALIAQLHRLDWYPFTEHAARYEADSAAILHDVIAASRQQYQQFGVAGFLAVTDWLDAHRHDFTLQPAVVHLDFHANNVFWCTDGTLKVIDWSQCSVSDYRHDLSWTLKIMGDHGLPHWYDAILEAYQRAAGHEVTHLDYFHVINDSKYLSSTVIALEIGAEKVGLRPGSLTLEEEAQPLRHTYQRMQRITGVSLPEVETLLKSTNA